MICLGRGEVIARMFGRRLPMIVWGHLSPNQALWAFYELRRIAASQAAGLQVGVRDRAFLRFVAPKFPEMTARLGSHIELNTSVGPNLYLPHGLAGIFIAGEAVIGSDCTIFQAVTIGRRGPHIPGSPVIGNGVLIGTGATILGNSRIGDGAKIGAGVALVDATITPGEVVINKSAYSLTRKAFIYPQD